MLSPSHSQQTQLGIEIGVAIGLGVMAWRVEAADRRKDNGTAHVEELARASEQYRGTDLETALRKVARRFRRKVHQYAKRGAVK